MLEVVLVAIAGVLGGAVAGAVAAALLLRGVARDEDVDELVKAVELQVREQRRERMRAVRRGETEVDRAPPPELVQPAQAAPAGNTKQALRERVFSMMRPGVSNVPTQEHRQGTG
jgi:hypothetical protein